MSEIIRYEHVDITYNGFKAVKDVSFTVDEGEILGIVGESGSGKSVLTKTFAGMLDSNGFIPEGSIIFSDDELSKTYVSLTPSNRRKLKLFNKILNRSAVYERGAAEYRLILQKEEEIRHAKSLTREEEESFAARLKEVRDGIVDLNNYIQTLDRHNAEDQKEIVSSQAKVTAFQEREKSLLAQQEEIIKTRTAAYEQDTQRRTADDQTLAALKAERERKMASSENSANPNGLSDEVIARNQILAYEILLSIGRYPYRSQLGFIRTLEEKLRIFFNGSDRKHRLSGVWL